MDFEYGCATVNKFAFLDENEVDDPSDLLAQVAIAKEAAAKGKELKAKLDAKGKKIDSKKAAAGKDKKPLQPSDNAVKKTTTDSKDQGKKMGGMGGQRAAGDLTGAKENRGPRPDRGERRPQTGGDRPPRQEGDRPPRQEGDRPPRRPQGDRPYQDRPPRQPRTDAEGNVIEQVEGEGYRGGYRGRGGATGGQRGEGGRGGYNRGPRRDEVEGEPRRFDRHSGSEKTGIKAVDKKDGAGKGNWGTATDEVVIEESLKEGEVAVEGGNKDWAERVDENEERKNEEPEEETPNFMTLEEYKALKSAVNKKNDFNVRVAGEGEDQSKWGKTYLLPKKPDTDEEESEEEESEEEVEEDAEDVQKKALIKTMQSAFKYESTNVSSDRGRGDRGGRGGRGGDRGGRGDRPYGDRPERREGGERPYGERREPRKAPEASDAAPAEAAPAGDAPASDAPVLGEAQPERKSFGFGERRPQQGGERSQGDRPARGGASSGGRGGRGGSSRGGSMAGRGPAAAKFSAPKFDDETAFPSLGM